MARYRYVARTCDRGSAVPADLLGETLDSVDPTGRQRHSISVRRFDADEVEWVTRVNYLGAVHAVGSVLPGMLDRDRGHLVGIGSLAGYRGLPRTAAYSASKAALYNFFESLRLDLRGTGVDVTVITPGYVRSEMTDKNEHSMPFLVEMDAAVDRMYRALRARKRLLTYPRPLSTLAWIGQVLPPRVYDWLAARQPR